MDVDFAENQTAKMSRMLLTHSLRLNQFNKEASYKYTITFDFISKVCVILADISTKAQELGEKKLIQSVPLEHVHFFFTVLYTNLQNIEVSFMPDSYYVFKLKLGSRSTVDSSLDNMTFMEKTLSLLFPSGFADPIDCEELHLKTKKLQIRLLMKKIQSSIPITQKRLNLIRDYEGFTLEFVKELQEDSNPVAASLVGSPLKVCAICRQQQMTQDVCFAAVDCCRHLYCMPCLKKHLNTRGKCPGCRDDISVTVSSSYMKRPAFKAGPPEKYALIMNNKGYIGRLW